MLTSTQLSVNPATPAPSGTTETLTRQSVPSAAAGSVVFQDGTTPLGSTMTNGSPRHLPDHLRVRKLLPRFSAAVGPNTDGNEWRRGGYGGGAGDHGEFSPLPPRARLPRLIRPYTRRGPTGTLVTTLWQPL